MTSRRRTWGWRVGAVVLVGGLVLANYGGVVPLAVAKDLNGVTPNWDQEIPAATRFVVLSDFANTAVRDNETGLVWEKSPDTKIYVWTTGDPFTGSSARYACANKAVGGRRGWRLPSLPELASLIDPSLGPPGPTLPSGHPFQNVQVTAGYWSATTDTELPNFAWGVGFITGFVFESIKTNGALVWCVRGGMNADAY